ncbi:FAD-linked oxidoreductase sorD [Cladobotryum mycophilum]|uniref:FAD-linked oxidoreductase sorD n=1 Tax=Cladobotryum mycophilum TaxID=491253 RepID=A0ABR0SCL6_9HYPO
MGNLTSNLGKDQAHIGHYNSLLQQCVADVCHGRDNCYSHPNTWMLKNWDYQRDWVKPYNLEVPMKPLAVVRPINAIEVAMSVKCANDVDVKVQARSGGHSYGNLGLGGIAKRGGLMIDLTGLKDFKMDTDTWQASFGSGFRLGELDQQLHNHGARAIAHGTCPGVGVGGHATVGGLGPMSRMWGSALDHVVEMEVVTADGSIVRASEKVNSDLFWAMRGAGASFGIVTEFVVKTHPEPGNVIDYSYSFNFGKQKDMAGIFKKWQKLIDDPEMDRRFSTQFIAQPLGAIITGTFYGTQKEWEASGIQEQLPSGGKVNVTVSNWLGSLAHIGEVMLLHLSDTPSHFDSKSLAFRHEDMLSDSAVDDLFAYMGDTDAGTLLWTVIFNSEGGAMMDVPMDATAYPHRDKLMMYQSYAINLGDMSDKTRGFVKGIHDKIQAGAPGAKTSYAGYIDRSLARNAAQSFYWGDKVTKLRDIKKKWDPADRFRNAQSIDLGPQDEKRAAPVMFEEVNRVIFRWSIAKREDEFGLRGLRGGWQPV